MSGPITGSWIRALRQRLGLSQVELAAILGVSNVTVNRWENDRALPQPGAAERLQNIERDGLEAVRDTAEARHDNLPVVFGPLVGRATDLDAVVSLLASHPLLTITGAAGAGKTRLAIEAGGVDRPSWPDGIWFVDLAAVHDPNAVVTVVANVLGVRDSGRKPLVDRLVDDFRDRTMLLILDNCEHLLAGCAELTGALLQAGWSSHILATSRVPIGVVGEVVYPLKPLAAIDAARLFVQRARERQPELVLDASESQTVTEICRRLDGLPLAIELAAARTHVLSVEQIAGRLDQRFDLLRSAVATAPRQRALDTAIAWSCDLLAPDEAALFRRLGAFVGWFDLPAVEAISERQDALDMLDALARQSMVVVEHDSGSRSARYRLLESLAAYARDWLEAQGETAEVERLHAAYYAGLVRDLVGGLRGLSQAALLAVLDREYANVIAALEWLLAVAEAEQATALAASLGSYWSLRGRYAEGISWLERVLTQQPVASEASRVAALIELGWLQYLATRFPEARTTMTEAVELARAHGSRHQEARALDTLGIVLAARRELDAAWDAHLSALQIAQDSGDRARAALSTLNLGRLTNLRGDNAGADRRFHEAWHLIQGTGETASEALILSHMGEVAARLGRYSRALDYYERTLALFQAIGDPDRTAVVATNTAEVKLVLGEVTTALPMAASAVAQFRAIGNPQHLAGATYIEGAALAAAGRLSEALSRFRETLALYYQQDDWIDVVYTVEAIARLLAEQGDAALAARLLGGCEAIRACDAVADYPLFDAAGTIAAVRKRLEPDDLALQWAEGRSLARSEIVADALHLGTVTDGDAVLILTRQRPPSRWDGNDVTLTERQIDVLRLVAAGKSNSEIGQELAISDRTVERHLTAIFGALDVNRRSAAVARATTLGLL